MAKNEKTRTLVKAKEFAPLFAFKNIGDSIRGMVDQIHEGKTKFDKDGEKATFLDLTTGNEDTPVQAVLLTAGLKSAYEWESLKGVEVEIIYSSDKPTPNGTMKVFEVYSY